MVDIYLVGVGGQGILTASKIIGDAALSSGRNVLLSETHGMAQRGGSVVCTARIGDVYSPLIPDGQADLILSFELLETLRALCKANKKTLVLSSTERIVPLSVSTQKLRYPTLEEVGIQVRKVAKDFVPVDARRMAEESDMPQASNLVMVGALAGAGVIGIERTHFERAIEVNVPRWIAENLDAFAKGYQLTSSWGRP